MAYVLYSSSLGVYLGEFGRHRFWSRHAEVPVREEAPCFETLEDVERLVNAWGPQARSFIESLAPVPVTPDVFVEGVPHATPAACVAAGLPGWISRNPSFGERARMH